MTVPIKYSCSWILMNILNQMKVVDQMEEWKQAEETHRYQNKVFYNGLMEQQQPVSWRKMFFDNGAIPRAQFIPRLATKSRLHRFGLLDNTTYFFCQEEETLNHLFFYCDRVNQI